LLLDFLIPAITFTCVMAFTPGPNNIMLTASGVNFGYVRTLPHIVGILLGMTTMIALAGFGLGGFFRAYPEAHSVLRVVGAAYLLFLAYKISTAASTSGDGDDGGKPLTPLQAALFQWVNPKGWTFILALVATFTTVEQYHLQIVLIVLINLIVTFSATTSWTLFGQAIGRFLTGEPRRLRAFNVMMGLLLVATVIPMALD